MTDSSFTNVYTALDGGIQLVNSEAKIEDSSFLNCTATSGAGI